MIDKLTFLLIPTGLNMNTHYKTLGNNADVKMRKSAENLTFL